MKKEAEKTKKKKGSTGGQTPSLFLTSISALADSLPEITRESLLESHKAPSLGGLNPMAARKKQRDSGIQQFQYALNNPTFRANPLGAIMDFVQHNADREREEADRQYRLANQKDEISRGTREKLAKKAEKKERKKQNKRVGNRMQM